MNVQSRYSVNQPMELVRTFFLHINKGTGANADHVVSNAVLAKSQKLKKINATVVLKRMTMKEMVGDIRMSEID